MEEDPCRQKRDHGDWKKSKEKRTFDEGKKGRVWQEERGRAKQSEAR